MKLGELAVPKGLLQIFKEQIRLTPAVHMSRPGSRQLKKTKGRIGVLHSERTGQETIQSGGPRESHCTPLRSLHAALNIWGFTKITLKIVGSPDHLDPNKAPLIPETLTSGSPGKARLLARALVHDRPRFDSKKGSHGACETQFIISGAWLEAANRA